MNTAQEVEAAFGLQDGSVNRSSVLQDASANRSSVSAKVAPTADVTSGRKQSMTRFSLPVEAAALVDVVPAAGKESSLARNLASKQRMSNLSVEAKGSDVSLREMLIGENRTNESIFKRWSTRSFGSRESGSKRSSQTSVNGMNGVNGDEARKINRKTTQVSFREGPASSRNSTTEESDAASKKRVSVDSLTSIALRPFRGRKKKGPLCRKI